MRDLEADVLDAYGALSLHHEAPQSLIDEAYWLLERLARERYAPGISALRVEQLTAAYEILSDPERRRAYDERQAVRAQAAHPAEEHDAKILDFPGRSAAPVRTSAYDLLRITPDAPPELIDLAADILARQAKPSPPSEQPAAPTASVPVPVHRLGAFSVLDAPPPPPPADAARMPAGPVPMHRLGGMTILEAPTRLDAPAPPVEAAPSSQAVARPLLFSPPAAPAPAPGRRMAPRPVVLDDRLSARQVVTRPQKIVGIAFITAMVLCLIYWPLPSMIALIGTVAIVYTAAIGYKGWLAAIAITERSETPIDPGDIAALTDEMLPVYTVLLPLYRETSVLRGLVESIAALDYPIDKLDVKLLLEEDDIEMQRAVAALGLPAHFERLIIPDIGPKGKPRACNYGLSYARGKYLALYDAEDRPEPIQLKKALLAFAAGGRNIACVQAKLNFYNPDQNLLTKWFTIEYSTWFDLYLPALNRMSAPIPLGGTSNHFRVAQLRQMGAWDEYNVTEDADLGLRLARHHFRTSVIDSVTYEEANSRLGNWIRQRSRWVKGYIQTWLVHMRHPVALFRELGATGFFVFQVMVFGTFFTYFVNPLFWVLVAAWYSTHAAGIQSLYPAPVLYISTLAFFVGNFIFIFTAVAGSLQRGFYHGVKYALLNHLYWGLMSIASWKALVQLFLRPHYWEKTQHGLDSGAAGKGAGAAG